MKYKLFLASIVSAVIITGSSCANNEDDTGGNNNTNKAAYIACTMECLSADPTSDIATFSAAAGATINVSFQFDGDLSNCVVSILGPGGEISGPFMGALTGNTLQTTGITVAPNALTPGQYYIAFRAWGANPFDIGITAVTDLSATQYTFTHLLTVGLIPVNVLYITIT